MLLVDTKAYIKCGISKEMNLQYPDNIPNNWIMNYLKLQILLVYMSTLGSIEMIRIFRTYISVVLI